MLDAILSPDWESRHYSFNSRWSEGELVASMRNGSGDHYFILFNSHGAIIKGFDHESPMSPFAKNPPEIWRGVLENVPAEFRGFLSEVAFEIEATTFCIWRRYSDSSWQVGNIDYPEHDDPDGCEDLLLLLDGKPETYRDFAANYFEKETPITAVRHIYEHKPLIDQIIFQLNADISVGELREDIEEIGYPKV